MSDRKRGQTRITVVQVLGGYIVQDRINKTVLAGPFAMKASAERQAKRERKKLGKEKKS